MVWVSGYPKGCLWCEAPYEQLRFVEQHFDQHDRIIVGEAVCGSCQGRMFYSARPEKHIADALTAGQQLLDLLDGGDEETPRD